MAIFHCAVSHGSRKDGQSGAAKVDYIMRTGKYSRDPGELLGACAGHLPSWAGGNPRVFFAAVDEHERSNGRLLTQVIFAIPTELNDQDALLLAYHYAEAVTENGAPYALAVHRGREAPADVESAEATPEEADEADLPPHNRHGHLVICERIDDGIERTGREWFRRANKKEPALGGAAKDREMNGGNWVPEVRHLCADYINYGLERAGFAGRVTCESHETRIARAEAAGDEETAERLRLNPPGIHLGPTAWAIEKGRKGRKSRPSWRGDLNQAIAAEAEKLRGKVEVIDAQLSQLDVQEGVVTERLEAARRVAAVQFSRREEALLGTLKGEDLLRAARVEVVGETDAALSVVQRGEVVELAEEKFGARLDRLEGELLETSVGSRYLAEAAASIVGVEEPPTRYQRETIVTTAVDRLGRELDGREASLQASAGGGEVLQSVQEEHAAEYGPVPTLAQCELQIGAAEDLLRKRREEEARRERAAVAERQEAERRQAEARRRAAVAGLEATLRATKRGPAWLAYAGRQVLSGASRELTLGEREQIAQTVVGWIRADLEQRKEKVASTDAGASFQRAAQRERDAAAPPATLAEEEQQVEQVEQRLHEHNAAEAHRAARQREEEKREREGKAHRAARLKALSPAGRELCAAHLTALAPAGDSAGRRSGADIDRTLDATASDTRLSRLEAVFEDFEQGSYYRAVPGAAGDEGTLQQIDEALEATETFVRRKQTIIEYPGGSSEHPDGGALYAAAFESRAPGWQPGAEIKSAVFDEALSDVESQLAERVRQAADEVEKLLPTTQRHPHSRPTPAVCDELLDGLVNEEDDAFYKETVAEVRKRYRHRTRYGAASYEEGYDDRARRTSQQAYLQDAVKTEQSSVKTEQSSSARPSWSAALAIVLKEYLSKIRELLRTACDKVLGGDLGERLARHREQVRRAADAAAVALPTTSPWLGSSTVPAVSDKTLSTVAAHASTPFVKEVVVEVGERYKRQARYDTPPEDRYDHGDRSRSESDYLRGALKRRQQRAQPTDEAEVLEEHRVSIVEVFEVACNEVVGRGDLGRRMRHRREQVHRVADAVVQELPTTMQSSYDRPGRHVPAVSDETLGAVRAGADSFHQQAVEIVRDLYDQCADEKTPIEEQYDAEDRRRSEADYLAAHVEKVWRTSTRQAARERVVKDHRSRVRGLFTAARDEVLRSYELQEQQREQSDRPSESRRAGDAGTSRRAVPEPPSERPSTPQGRERIPSWFKQILNAEIGHDGKDAPHPAERSPKPDDRGQDPSRPRGRRDLGPS